MNNNNKQDIIDLGPLWKKQGRILMNYWYAITLPLYMQLQEYCNTIKKVTSKISFKII